MAREGREEGKGARWLDWVICTKGQRESKKACSKHDGGARWQVLGGVHVWEAWKAEGHTTAHTKEGHQPTPSRSIPHPAVSLPPLSLPPPSNHHSVLPQSLLLPSEYPLPPPPPLPLPLLLVQISGSAMPLLLLTRLLSKGRGGKAWV
jgi:hypothetical protein